MRLTLKPKDKAFLNTLILTKGLTDQEVLFSLWTAINSLDPTEYGVHEQFMEARHDSTIMPIQGLPAGVDCEEVDAIAHSLGRE